MLVNNSVMSKHAVGHATLRGYVSFDMYSRVNAVVIYNAEIKTIHTYSSSFQIDSN